MANDWSEWANPDDLAKMSRGAVTPLQDAGYDPDELRADPAKRQEVMAQLRSPYGLQQHVEAAMSRTPQTGSASTIPGGSGAQPAVPAQQPAVAQPASPAPQVTGSTPQAVKPAGRTESLYSVGQEALERGLGLGKLAEQESRELASTTGPDTAALEAQRSRDALPTTAYDANGKVLPQYRPSFGRRLLRGVEGFREGGIFGAIDPGGVGATPYGAPNPTYQREEATRTARLASEDQQLANAAARFKAMTDARKTGAEEARGGVSAYNDVAKGAQGLLTAGNNTQKNQASLREHGLAIDDQGNIAPLPYDQLTPQQQADYDLKNARQEMADATADLRRSQNDPNSPSYKLALARLKNAQVNARAAMTRATAYMGNYLEGAFNTDLHGNTLPGATTIVDENGNLTVVGTRNAGAASKAQSAAAQFNDVNGALDALDSAARRMVARGEKPDATLVAGALAQPDGTAGKWLQGQFAKSNLSPEQRDYVTQLVAAHENIQALRKSAGGGVSDSQVDRLIQMLPDASTPDLDYFLRQTGQIRATANRLGMGVTTAHGGLHVRGQGTGTAATGTSQPSHPASGFWSNQPKRDQPEQ